MSVSTFILLAIFANFIDSYYDLPKISIELNVPENTSPAPVTLIILFDCGTFYFLISPLP